MAPNTHQTPAVIITQTSVNNLANFKLDRNHTLQVSMPIIWLTFTNKNEYSQLSGEAWNIYFPLFGGREICKNNKIFFFMITQKSWVKQKIELGLRL